MNDYSNMNYMPDDFEYLNRLYNFGMPNMMQNNGMMQMQNQNMGENAQLQAKLAKQAGDNMNFNKGNYNQQINPNEVYDVYGGFIRGNMFPDLYNQYKNNKPFEIKPMNEQA